MTGEFVMEENYIEWLVKRRDPVYAIPVKIIMLTAKSAAASELQGLVTGADDYIRKPFDMEILLVRIKKTVQYGIHPALRSGFPESPDS